MIPRRPLAAAALLATAAAALLAAASVPAPAGAHSTIAWPTPTHKSDCSFIPGRKMKCLGHGQTACPRTQRPNEAGKNWRQPAATWARGQQVTLRYKKNNHGPVGFVRWSLVPAKLHYSNDAHTKFAFWWNCWGSGFHDCRGDECGTDGKRKAWASQVTIPTSIPDGNYVLGFVWYGFGGENFGKLRFPAYWSCSMVRIRGGRQTDTWTPRFVPVTGRKAPNLRGSRQQQDTQCLSGVDRLGVCDRVTPACKQRRVKFMVPVQFQGGRRPQPLTKKMYLDARR